jgi:hypothetical protein
MEWRNNMSSFRKENTNNSKEDIQELSALYEETGRELEEQYQLRFWEILCELGLFEPDHGPVPREIWIGIAQAIADCSGYRLVLQAHILEPDTRRTVGHRDMASADPMDWVQEA